MLGITRNIVNDRNSNRLDNVMGIACSDLGNLVGHCLHLSRCLLHQLCSDRFALRRELSSRGWGGGFKRYAYEPAKTTFATPTMRRTRLFASSEADLRVVNLAG